MLLIKYKILFFTLIIRSYADDFISDEKREQIDRKDKNTYSKVERRFLENLDDETWHVSHLKDTDFSGRRAGCPDDTFEDKVKRYRKTLLNDGALVEYVSADAIPFNKTELVSDVCRAPDKKGLFLKAHQSEASGHPEQGTAKLVLNETQTKASEKVATAKTSSDTLDTVYVATTTTKKAKSHEDKPPKSRKASEYQFSSIEYYDETIDFDSGARCPDDVEEIVLEIDHIRNYDIRCEQILEWKSLD